MLEGLWSFLGIFWGQNGGRNVTVKVLRAILAQIEVARVSQRLSMGRFGEDVHHVFCDIVYFRMFFCYKKYVVHAVWYLDLDS